MTRLTGAWMLGAFLCTVTAAWSKPVVIVDGVPIDERVIDRKMKIHAGRLTKREYVRKRAEYVAETIKLYLKRKFAEEKLGYIDVTEREVDESIEEIKEQTARDPGLRGITFEEILAFQGITMEELRRRQKNNIRYLKYLRGRVTEEMCRKYYEKHRDFFDGTAVRASIIFFPVDGERNQGEGNARARAEKIAAEIKKHPSREAFAAAARAISAHPSARKGGDIGFFTRFDRGVPKAVAAAAFGVKRGEVTGPVSSPEGYYVVMVTDRRKGSRSTYEECREIVYAWLVYREDARVVADLIKKADIVFPGITRTGRHEGKDKEGTAGKETRETTGTPLSEGTHR